MLGDFLLRKLDFRIADLLSHSRQILVRNFDFEISQHDLLFERTGLHFENLEITFFLGNIADDLLGLRENNVELPLRFLTLNPRLLRVIKIIIFTRLNILFKSYLPP
jgi:hypothetical protein